MFFGKLNESQKVVFFKDVTLKETSVSQKSYINCEKPEYLNLRTVKCLELIESSGLESIDFTILDKIEKLFVCKHAMDGFVDSRL